MAEVNFMAAIAFIEGGYTDGGQGPSCSSNEAIILAKELTPGDSGEVAFAFIEKGYTDGPGTGVFL